MKILKITSKEELEKAKIREWNYIEYKNYEEPDFLYEEYGGAGLRFGYREVLVPLE